MAYQIAFDTFAVSLDALVKPVSLPAPEPLSFGFAEIVKAKAEFNAEFMAGLDERMLKSLLSLNEGSDDITPYTSTIPKYDPSNNASPSFAWEYVYDYGLVGELAALKRKKNTTR